jgi:hypothetical protein
MFDGPIDQERRSADEQLQRGIGSRASWSWRAILGRKCIGASEPVGWQRTLSSTTLGTDAEKETCHEN